MLDACNAFWYVCNVLPCFSLWSIDVVTISGKFVRIRVVSGTLLQVRYFSRSARCTLIRLLVTTFNNSNNLLELSFHAYKMNPDPNPNPNPDNPNNLLDTVVVLGYNVWIEWIFPSSLLQNVNNLHRLVKKRTPLLTLATYLVPGLIFYRYTV